MAVALNRGHARQGRQVLPGPVGLMFEVSDGRRRQVAAEQGVAEGDLYEGPLITLRCPDHVVAMDVIAERTEHVFGRSRASSVMGWPFTVIGPPATGRL